MVEAGLAGYKAETWYGILAPAGTSSAIINRLSAEVRKALDAPDLKNQFFTQGLNPAPMTPDQFATLIRDDFNKWSKLIKEAKISAN